MRVANMKKVLCAACLLFITGPVHAAAAELDQFGFGVGLSFAWDLGSNDRVDDVEVVDGIVRVSDKGNGIASLVLESHYYTGTIWGAAVGPFVAIRTGDSEIIDAAAIGVMFGWKSPAADSAGFNLGLGFVADPNVEVLGSGVIENQALPGNETTVRTSEETQGGVILIFSRNF